MGFNVHQRTWKKVLDPDVRRVLVVRYLCKKCRYVRRVYPEGIGPDRQSAALKQISLLLYCFGLSYRNVRSALGDLGCPLSSSIVRRNVLVAGPALQVGVLAPERRRLAPVGRARFSGPEGSIAVRLVGPSPSQRWLEVEISSGPGSGPLIEQLIHCGRWLDAGAGAQRHSHREVHEASTQK